jgi:very-short-patch-repair endonuclease
MNPPSDTAHPLRAILQRARLALLQTDNRNRLVNTPRHARRTKSVSLVDDVADNTFSLLVRDKRKLAFKPMPGATSHVLPSEESGGTPNLPARIRSGVDGWLQTRLNPENLQRRLLALQRDAKALEDEQGINVLFLAMGFLKWFESPNSDIAHEAPLVLVPVSLERDNARSTMRLVMRDADLETNLSLQEKFKQDFGILLPDIPDILEIEDWMPASYFAQVAQVTEAQPRWSIDGNGMFLGFFSFSKLLMFRDLVAESWPGQSILSHPLLDGLLQSGFPAAAPLFPDDAKLDEVIDAASLIQVVDADASQSLVAEAVRAGRDLVVQGPPGTGKSQTITNIIAAAVHDGKTVLFVAEKMAALNVVHDRLAKAGLEPICLELHSRKVSKRAVHSALERTLNTTIAARPGDESVNRLRTVRGRLNSDDALLHSPLLPCGVSPFQALADQILLRASGHDVPEIVLPGAARWPAKDWAAASEALDRLAERTRDAGPAAEHPWRGVMESGLQPADRVRLSRDTEALAAAARALDERLAGLSETLGCDPDPSIETAEALVGVAEHLSRRPVAHYALWEVLVSAERIESLLDIATTGLAFQSAHEAVQTSFVDIAMAADVRALQNEIAPGMTSFLYRLGGRYRRASRALGSLLKTALPREADRRVALLDSLAKAHRLAGELAAESELAASILAGEWRAEKTNFALLRASVAWMLALEPSVKIDARRAALSKLETLDWLGVAASLRQESARLRERLESIAHTLKLDIPLAFGVLVTGSLRISALIARAEAWLTQGERLPEWIGLLHADRATRAVGLSVFADRLADGRLRPDHAPTELRYARAEAVWKAALAQQPGLSSLQGDQRDRLVQDFKSFEAGRRLDVAWEILARHGAAKPAGGMGDMSVIRGEINRQNRHMPLRKLMERAGPTIQKIKPVFLMSPLSVAQFLPPGKLEFDLLVIDEASQVKPEDALGAIARVKQIVVVGDKKQLPPSVFFERAISDDEPEDEDYTVPLTESILGLCETRGLPGKMLRWHYRSRHPSLIAVSNAEFYEGRLFMPPSPDRNAGSTGLSVSRVDGAYDRGGKRTNETEAREVVEAVVEHARTAPGLSLGVVTFSAAQKELIDDLIEDAKIRHPHLDAFATQSSTEEFFVKNLENVQGDERDVIFISIGYGPRIAGHALDSMAFGPVSAEGGERRLNVLFTRAKCQCRVFVSFNSGDIRLDPTANNGPRILQRFLRYAESGIIDQAIPTGEDPDSPFEEAVAQAVREWGFEVDHQVGSAGFRIDLAVRNPDRPGTYLMAIECDGATYHSAQWARERDRLRQEILEGMGWRFHRIWSTDWFRTPEAAKRKLSVVLGQSRSDAGNPKKPPASTATPVERLSNVSQPTRPDSLGSAERRAPGYTEASFPVSLVGELHEVPVDNLASIVERIVQIEAPIHEEEVARRAARMMNKDRAGNRILSSVRTALNHAANKLGTIRSDGKYWVPTASDWMPKVRDRSAASTSLQKADAIAPSEIECAIAVVVGTNGRLPRDQVAVAASRLLGFQRTGRDLRLHIETTLNNMIIKGKVGDDDGHVVLRP